VTDWGDGFQDELSLSYIQHTFVSFHKIHPQYTFSCGVICNNEFLVVCFVGNIVSRTVTIPGVSEIEIMDKLAQ